MCHKVPEEGGSGGGVIHPDPNCQLSHLLPSGTPGGERSFLGSGLSTSFIQFFYSSLVRGWRYEQMVPQEKEMYNFESESEVKINFLTQI